MSITRQFGGEVVLTKKLDMYALCRETLLVGHTVSSGDFIVLGS